MLWKQFIIVKAHPFTRVCYFQWKPFLLVGLITLSGSHYMVQNKCVNESKTFLLFQKKWQMVPFSYFCNYATVGHIGMHIFNFVALSVIIALHNVLVEAITFSETISSLFKWSHSLEWKLFISVEAIPCSGGHFTYWNCTF